MGLGCTRTSKPSHRKSRHAPGYETESRYNDRRENTGKKIDKTEGSDHASAGKDHIMRGPSETQEGPCGGSDQQCAHPDCKRETRVSYGHAECVLANARELGWSFIGLEETRRPGKTDFSLQGTGFSSLGKRKRKPGKDCLSLIHI